MNETVLAWIAVGAAFLALVKQGYDLVFKAKKEKLSIDDALDKQPILKEQLEIGNVKGAVETLNQIITAQAITLDRCMGREEALEAEAQGWENRYRESDREWQKRYDALYAEMVHMRQKIERLEARNA